MKRPYLSPPDSERCAAHAPTTVKGEGARCQRRRKIGDLCQQHAALAAKNDTPERVLKEGLTESEAELLHKMSEEYWGAFSKLVGETLDKVPHYLQDRALAIIEDKSSAHGSAFQRHMKRPPPFVERFNAVLRQRRKPRSTT